ncbi:MAG: MnmC family methyltransferase [Proteobacteria bacterium]|nr:MnmC family methyltransferase [Pseudomonadota bacterium]
MSIHDFEIVTTSAGALSIRNKVVGEIMHNPVGPWVEANALYIDQPKLREEFKSFKDREFHIYDVGLGSASNAIAAIDALLKLKDQSPTCKLKLTSFENNLDLLRFTLIHADRFPHLTNYKAALESLLHHHVWMSPCETVQWSLIEGDFNQTIVNAASNPNLIFFDPYSPGVNQDMWTLECFKRLRAKCFALDEEAHTNLFTYSISTPIRTAMLLAGFFVGHGQATGLKEETTQASTKFDKLLDPLAEKWFGRWSRSHRQWPYDVEQLDLGSLLQTFKMHPQVLKNLPNL